MTKPIETTSLYNGQVKLIFNAPKHLYTVNRKVVPGVTSILQVINKPALMYWAVNMAIKALEESWKPGIRYDEIQIKERLLQAKSAHRKKKESAGDMGTLIHAWIEEWMSGICPAKPVNTIMRQAVENFLAWTKKYDLKFLHSERKIYSQKYNYAGTCDFVATIDGHTIVGDIKTSSGIYDEMFFQTAAYQQALTEEFPDLKFKSNVIIRCGKDGTFEIKETEDFDKNIKAFLGSLAIYNRQQELKDEAYGNK